MKTKLFLITIILFINFKSLSQEILQPSDEKTYTEYMDKVLEDVKLNDASLIKNGILYDRVYQLAKLDQFNKNDTLNTSSFNHFSRSWDEIFKSSLSPDFISEEVMKSVSYSYERQGIIQVGIINVDFTTIDSTALKAEDPKLEIVNQKIQRITNKNPFVDNHVFIISTLNNDYLIGNSLTLQFGTLILEKSSKHIKNLNVYFENNQSFEIFSNGNLINNQINVNFLTDGRKEMTTDVEFNDGTFLTTYADFFIRTQDNLTNREGVSSLLSISAAQSFQGYNEPADCNGSCIGKGEYKIFLSNSHTALTKPFLIVDGIDPHDNRKIDGEGSIYEMMYYNGNSNNLVLDLNDLNYDVIILSFPQYVIRQQQINILGHNFTIDIYRDGGVDYIERNAKVLEALINRINQDLIINGSTEHLKIAGPSMGALIVRYALREMEVQNINHNTDLYISFDGPHKGANIPIGMQKAVNYFDLSDAKYPLNSPSAKQMLINHYLSDLSSVTIVNGNIVYTPEAGGLPAGAPNFRTRFQTELDNLGFPQQCRNITSINGSVMGELKATPASNMFQGDLTAFMGFLQRNAKINYTSDSGQSIVFRYIKKNYWGLNTQADIKKKSTTSSTVGSLDNAPGGYFNVKGRTESYLGGNFPYFYYDGVTNATAFYEELNWFEELLFNIVVGYAYVDLKDDFSFVPTKSALAFNGTNQLLKEQIGCRNLVCTGETPFENYYAPYNNTEHASLSTEGVNWLIQELDVDPTFPEASVYDSCLISNLIISGSNILCYNSSSNYTINNACTSYIPSWSTSTNLQIISQANNQLVVKNINQNMGNGWIKATFPNNQYVIKYIIGKPSINIQTQQNSYSPEIELIGNGVNLQNQGVINISWQKTGGNGILHAFNNESTAYATGSGSSWFVNGSVTVTNSCGSTIQNFVIAPSNSGDDPCNTLLLQKISTNKYQVIDPCDPNTLQYIDDSELYSEYGYKIQDLIPENDKIDIENTADEGTIRIIKAEVGGKTATKMIIVD